MENQFSLNSAMENFLIYESRDADALKSKLIEHTDLLLYLNEVLAEKNVTLSEGAIYSEQFIFKAYLNSRSILKLVEGEGFNNPFYKHIVTKPFLVDISAIITILRTQYESLLIYNHLYINSTDGNEQKLRFDAFVMSSKMDRRKIFADTEPLEPERIEFENKHIESLVESIKLNPAFNNLSSKQQKQLIEKGSGKLFKNFDKLFDEAGFLRKGIFGKIYFLMSMYAHNEGISVLQMKESQHLIDDENIINLLTSTLLYSNIMVCIFIKNMVDKFPTVAERYKTIDQTLKESVAVNCYLAFN